MRISLLSFAALLLLLNGGGSDALESADQTAKIMLVRDHRTSTGGSAYDLEATPVFELPIAITAGRRVVFETRNLSAGSDPVLHLLSPSASEGGDAHEVARDDDSAGNRAARIIYTPSISGSYTIVMRAAWKGRSGTADLYRDGRRVGPRLPFGGAFKRAEGLRAAEKLVTVALPLGPYYHTLYVLDDEGAMLERHRSGVTQGLTRTVPNAWGTRYLMMGVGWTAAPGLVRLVRNDSALAGHDTDDDGLGNELEAQIGTCSRPTDIAGALWEPDRNWECSDSTDMRDTDGDGISDSLEFLGKLDSVPYQFLPRWGADPRHKDIFIEVDFMITTRRQSVGTMSPAVARRMAAIYADPETDPSLRLAHAQALGNPDLQPGIRLHIDSGVSPLRGTPESDFTIYGDWGGHGSVRPVRCADDGNCTGTKASAAWGTHMHLNRRGIFHYALTYSTGGGSTPYHTIYSSFNHNDPANAAHEFGHSLGLGHSGAVDSEAIDANCKPNYPSLMNYAYLHQDHRAFSDGLGRPVLNNTRLTERSAVLSPTSLTGLRYFEDLREVFGYTVDLSAGHVDWNRDGVFSPGTVRAYANKNGEDCEFPKYNAVRLPGVTGRSPALVRLGDMTIAFHLDADGHLNFDYTLDNLACPTPAVTGCGAPFNRRYIDESWNTRTIRAFDAHRIRDGNQDKILVVYLDSRSSLWEVKFSRSGFDWSAPARITTISPPVDELSLAGDEETVYLTYKGIGRLPMFKERARGVWSEDEIIRDTTGSLIPRIPAGSSPSLLRAGTPNGPVLFGIFPREESDAAQNGRLRLYTFNLSTRRWALSPWLTASEPTVGKPAMAWVPLPADSALPGRLHLFWLRRADNGETVVRESMLIARQQGEGPQLGLPSNHQNKWFRGSGIDLLYEDGVDTNLRALLGLKKEDEDNKLLPARMELFPKADEILDFNLRTWNDWEVLRVDTCRVLSAFSGASNPIRCPVWTW